MFASPGWAWAKVHCRGLCLAGLALQVACGSDDPLRTGQARAAIVHASDGRSDYFDESDPDIQDLLARSTVALIPNQWLELRSGHLTDPPTLSAQEGVCESERFAAQPAASFCSGVLVDWDLVLTAGHCLRLLALDDFSVVFDYYYASEGALALGKKSHHRPAEIVAEALDPAGVSPRLDYGWIRLEHPVGADRRPVPVYLQPVLAAKDPLITVGTPHGLPAKTETSGAIEDPRDGSDYFIARADVSAGWSGGGAFDPSLGLLGILARGETDLTPTVRGCNTEAYASEDTAGDEEFTYASAALTALCSSSAARSSLCRPGCEEPCAALPAPDDAKNPTGIEAAGCALAPRSRTPLSALPLLFAGIGCWLRGRAHRRAAAIAWTPDPRHDRVRAMSTDSHGRPGGGSTKALGRPASGDVATPSHAERARTLLASTSTGTLCTLAREPVGFPYGSLVTFGLVEGEPVFLVSDLAEHTRNLREDGRASLLVAESRAGDPRALGRVTLLGQCAPATAGQVESARDAYLAHHPGAAQYAGFSDFSFWVLAVRAVRYIGGYGSMSWIELDAWRSALPDPIAPDAAAILAHMNEDHADALPLYCRAFWGLNDISQVSTTGIDRLGFEMSVTTPSGTQTLRLPFSAPIGDKTDARNALVALLKEARARLGVSPG